MLRVSPEVAMLPVLIPGVKVDRIRPTPATPGRDDRKISPATTTSNTQHYCPVGGPQVQHRPNRLSPPDLACTSSLTSGPLSHSTGKLLPSPVSRVTSSLAYRPVSHRSVCNRFSYNTFALCWLLYEPQIIFPANAARARRHRRPRLPVPPGRAQGSHPRSNLQRPHLRRHGRRQSARHARHQSRHRCRRRGRRRHPHLPCRNLPLLHHPPQVQHRALSLPRQHHPRRGLAQTRRDHRLQRRDLRRRRTRNDPFDPYADYGHNHWRNSLFYAEKTSTTSPSPAPASSSARPLPRLQRPSRRLLRLRRQSARRRQQGHRPQELPQRNPARLQPPQGRPLRRPRHRSR